MKKTRILIADDHDVVRSGLRMLLRTHPEFSVTGEAADGGLHCLDPLAEADGVASLMGDEMHVVGHDDEAAGEPR